MNINKEFITSCSKYWRITAFSYNSACKASKFWLKLGFLKNVYNNTEIPIFRHLEWLLLKKNLKIMVWCDCIMKCKVNKILSNSILSIVQRSILGVKLRLRNAVQNHERAEDSKESKIPLMFALI